MQDKNFKGIFNAYNTYHNEDRFIYCGDLYEVVIKDNRSVSMEWPENNPHYKQIPNDMKETDEKTIYDLKQAKYNLEKEIGNCVLKFEQEYRVTVDSIGLNSIMAFGVGAVTVNINVEIKL